MKIIISLILSLFTCSFSHANYKGLHCAENHNSTAYGFDKIGDNYRLTVNHLGGLGVAVIDTQKVTTLGRLEWLALKAKAFKAMGELYTIDFNKEECQFSADRKTGYCLSLNKQVGPIETKSVAFSFVIGNPIAHGRVDQTKISLEWRLPDTSIYQSGIDGNRHQINVLAIDLDFSKTCVFRGF